MMKKQSTLNLQHYHPSRTARSMFLEQPVHLVVKTSLPFWAWCLAASAGGAMVVTAAWYVMKALG